MHAVFCFQQLLFLSLCLCFCRDGGYSRDEGYRGARRWEEGRGYGGSRARSRSASRERREWRAKLAARRRESSEEGEAAPNSEDKDLTEEQLMQKLMGFDGFSSSKGKEHTSTDVSGVSKRSRRRYRQYMNRKGGFNRPLSPVF